MNGRRWSTKQVCELTGCTYRQADYWLRRGVLADTACGSGSHRSFTDREVEAFAACKQAADLLASTAALKVLADAVLVAPIEAGDHVVVEGHTIRRWNPCEPLNTGGAVVVLIPLRPIDDLTETSGVAPASPGGTGSTAGPKHGDTHPAPCATEHAAAAPPGSRRAGGSRRHHLSPDTARPRHVR